MEDDVEYRDNQLIPSMEEFLDKLYDLHPIGQPDIIYTVMKDHLGKPLPKGGVLTFDLLCKRYDDYCKYIKPYNDIKDKQYIKKDKQHKEIGAYLLLQMYLNDYATQVGDINDNYLFGI